MAESGPEEAAEGRMPDPGLFFEHSEEPMAIVSLHGRWLRVNPAFARRSGWRQEELQGQPVSRLVHADDREAFDRILRGEAPGAVELHLLTADGTFQGERWRFTAVPASDVLLGFGEGPWGDGVPAGPGSRHLVEEIEHRVRNHLAVVRSIIRRTLASATDSETFAHLQGRIDSYARVQSRLRFAGNGGGVDLALLIEDELLAQSIREGDQLTIEGPDLTLSAKAAEAIGLAVHELAMNAVKFGAFCIEGARADVRWSIQQVDAESRLLFTWTESGVPLPDAARRPGFGMETLLQSLPYDLDAKTGIEWRLGGIAFTMTVPLSRVVAPSAGR